MKKQYTSGPWALNGSSLLKITGAPANIHIATIYDCKPSDRRLIAAAPELLEALFELATLEVKGHSLIDRLQFSTEGRELRNKITNAILKATGGEYYEK